MRRPLALALATTAPLLALALALGGCSDTVQDQPIASNALEQLVALEETPVYWLGLSFRGLQMSEVIPDPGGAYTLQYGNCTIGGQSICVPPLEIVTSPDSSFVPGGHVGGRRLRVRGVPAVSFREGRTIELATGSVVIDIYASSASLARAAAQTMVPVNRLAVPGSRLPAARPNSRFESVPLRYQQPPAVHVLPSRAHRRRHQRARRHPGARR